MMFDSAIWMGVWVVLQNIFAICLLFGTAGIIVWKVYDHIEKVKNIKDAIKVAIWARLARKSIHELTIEELNLNIRHYMYNNPNDWKIIKKNMDEVYTLCQEKLKEDKKNVS